MENNKIKNLEKRMTRVEKKLKLKETKPSIPVICEKCGHPINTRSKLSLISCPDCGKKTKNTSLKEEKEEPFDAFKGKRYEDYDFKDMKKLHFEGKKFSKCCQCGKKVDFENSYYGYNDLRCKKCYAKFTKQADEEVGKMVQRL